MPPKNNGAVKSYSLTAGASGYTADQSLSQQYNIWRVLNKNEDGTLDIMPAFNKADLPSGTTNYTAIYFQDAKGWNNAPYLLDDMCSFLYADEDNGITARSIDYEDITSRMIEGIEGTNSANSTGLKRISKYQSEVVASVVKNGGPYIYSSDTSKNTITYKGPTSTRRNTLYPILYPEVKEDESNSYYTVSTIDTNSSSNGRIESKPTTLMVRYTNYSGEIAFSDFENRNAYNVIFETRENYWVASRSVGCSSEYANFYLRYVNTSNLRGVELFESNGSKSSSNKIISPLITLESNVQVTKCTGTNDQNNRHTVVIPN